MKLSNLFSRISLLLNLLFGLLALVKKSDSTGLIRWERSELFILLLILATVTLLILSIANGAFIPFSKKQIVTRAVFLSSSFIFAIISASFSKLELVASPVPVWSLTNGLLLVVAVFMVIKYVLKQCFQKFEKLIFELFLDYH
ncbi:hypothetical protein [Kangiella sp. TOML190]|uniref:hypothetical protein n=1 Tax=Kangiella sp. TOML190 TaxID=2931351 RepID=UPI00203EFA97|nr:hypothetical protein [Kangiella sp. TOML190]